ncbi:MAG: hypothetical protein JKY08_09455 [Flavobacteriaceae bacterium]|nr:hypothetical protein [Flavobacteriaceae bacterium]
MKFIQILILLTVSFGFSQTSKYGHLLKKSSFKSYITKAGNTLKIGDTLIIGIPTSELGFKFISQGGQSVANRLAGKKIIIHKMKTYGEPQNGFKMYPQFKGYGLLPVLIDYEIALSTGEIKNPTAKLTRKEAIEKLSEHKKLLELDVISLEEYDNLKKKLIIIIKKG